MEKERKTKGIATKSDKVIGENLKQIRLAMSLSQERMSELAGVTFQQIQKYETGKNRIAASKLVRISNALDIDIKVFYDGLIENEKTQISLKSLSKEQLRLLSLLTDVDDPKVIKTLISLLQK